MRWQWRQQGSDLGVANLVRSDGTVLVRLEIHFMPETVYAFWLDPSWCPFHVHRSVGRA